MWDATHDDVLEQSTQGAELAVCASDDERAVQPVGGLFFDE